MRLEYIFSGKPQQNAYDERYNRIMRYDWLTQYSFEAIDEVQDYATKWLLAYNNERPHSALGAYPPRTRLDKAASDYFSSP